MDEVDKYFRMVQILKACKDAGYKELFIGHKRDYEARQQKWSRVFAGWLYVRPKITNYKGKAGAPITHIIREAFPDVATPDFYSLLSGLPRGEYDLTKPIEEIVRLK